MKNQTLISLTPFILTAYPVLYMLSANVEVVDFADIVLSLAAYEIGALATLAASWFIFKNRDKAVFITSIVVVIFFTYGHIFALINASWAHWVLVSLSLIIMSVALRVTRTKTRWLPQIVSYMGLTGGILVLFSISTVFYYSMTVSSAQAFSLDTVLGLDSVDESLIDPEMLNHNIDLDVEQYTTPPDVYYIILDEYANSNVLMDLHGFDNSPFLNALEERGFFVTGDSRANYPVTFLSLSSSLNMDYMNFLSGHDRDFTVPYHLIDYSRVSGIFRNAGYEIVYFPSIYYVTSDMESADITYEIERELPVLGLDYSNFDLALFDSTLLGALLDDAEDYDVLDDYRETTQFALDNLRRIPEIDAPTFTFAHLTVPHRPYVFTAEDAPSVPVDGEVVREGRYASYTAESDIASYLEQINFINRAITAVIDDILATSETPPIIVLQSDHGHRMQGEPGVDEWGPAEIYENVFPILNAYYLPEYDGAPIDPAVTPVNTFRLIFDHYFGTNFGLIDNRSFYPEDYFSYDFIEVTDGVIREVPPAPDVEN